MTGSHHDDRSTPGLQQPDAVADEAEHHRRQPERCLEEQQVGEETDREPEDRSHAGPGHDSPGHRDEQHEVGVHAGHPHVGQQLGVHHARDEHEQRHLEAGPDQITIAQPGVHLRTLTYDSRWRSTTGSMVTSCCNELGTALAVRTRPRGWLPGTPRPGGRW